MPQWNAENLGKALQLSKRGPSFERPAELAALVVGDEFSLSSREPDGREIFRGAKTNLVVHSEPKNGFVKFFKTPKVINGQISRFSSEDAVARVKGLFARLSLPEEEAGDLITRDIVVGNNKISRIVARHVEIHRKRNGYRVQGSHLMATFDLEGNMFQFDVTWPEFRVKTGTLGQPFRSRETAVVDIAKLVADLAARHGPPSKVLSEIVYRYHADTKFFEPTMNIGVFGPGYKTPPYLQYSLVGGYLTPKHAPDNKGNF